MKRALFVLLVLIPFLSFSQAKSKVRKYPSLLWEISGNGLQKPSYLFGTMHVSSKLAFHLADSFYLGIRNADVVALETNPESWQEDMSKYEFGENSFPSFGRFSGYFSLPDEYLNRNTLKFYKYDKKIERSLYSNPSTINNLLYRTYGNQSSDFEEDTYLDMYIYQCGKKWGKLVAGVERYDESMKLMQEAYKDAIRDRNKKRYGDVDEEYSTSRLQEAYRKGNLDQLDSINKINSFSDAFDEKFLYKRNEIQANSIDSILKSKASLFVGVGAAHLPGARGVIEMLRDKGYRLRPIMMGERDSRHKDEVEKIRVPVTFKKFSSADGFFSAEIPGTFYEFGDDDALDQLQYADMANGSYYMVTRIMTNAWMWGHSQDDVYRKIDSLLYENIPGKIISKSRIVKNGYPGFDITNRTRRGDVQRYNILVTPFEVIFFKMSGNGDYVRSGEEATRFFNSISLREFQGAAARSYTTFSPAYGGFSVNLPHTPYTGNDGNWIYDAADKEASVFYRVVRTDIHNYHFAEEDSFDLALLEESFSSSEFIDKKTSRKFIVYQGYPALESKYRTKNGDILAARFIIQGPHYYTLVSASKKQVPLMDGFFNSFKLLPLKYPAAKEHVDTALYFRVKSPVFPETGKQKLSIPRFNYGVDEDEDTTGSDILEEGAFRSRIISNDTTGEKIYVSFYRTPGYFVRKDSINTDKDPVLTIMGTDSSWIVRSRSAKTLPGKMQVFEVVLSDTGSSRLIWNKRFYRNGIGFSLITQLDTLTGPSSFVRTFFDSFTPADTLKGVDPFARKSQVFFNDLLGKDSTARKRALRNIAMIELDSTDLPKLKKAIQSLRFTEKNYLDTKKSLISKLSDIPVRSATDYLHELYYAAADTIELQYAVLESLLEQQNKYAFEKFRDIMVTEPPVIEKDASEEVDYTAILRNMGSVFDDNFGNNGFLDELRDTLELTKTILPDLLPLMNLDDYRAPLMSLLSVMVDSNLVGPKDYEIYFSKFMIEARQELKKQAISEKRKAIAKAEEDKSGNNVVPYFMNRDEDNGNAKLLLYAKLLLPYWETNPAIQPLFKQMLQSGDTRLKYDIFLLLVKKGKPYPDSMFNYFAKKDDYRYELYRDLKLVKKQSLFPVAFNNHLDLGRSSLLEKRSYGKPDTIAYIKRLPATYKGKSGFVYFFKYKAQREDMNWKIATVGLVPADPKEFYYETAKPAIPGWSTFQRPLAGQGYDFTQLTETRLSPDEPLDTQLETELKKLLYSRRKSAKEFYQTSNEYNPYEYLRQLDR
jgi:uncharacterized protein YbaP (TraB family)